MNLRRLLGRWAPGPGGPPRVFIHIGMNKTGTTAIQSTLARNYKALARQGLLYARAGRARGSAHYRLSHTLGFAHNVPEGEAVPREVLARQILDEARARRCRDILVSSEAFVIPGDVGAVRAFFAGCECRIVVYLRRHDHWWASSYSQGINSVADPKWPSGFEGFLAQQRKRPTKGDYRWLLERWAEVFGPENLIVRPYERAQNRPDVVADLLQAIGYGHVAEAGGLEVPTLNESPGERELMIIDALQRAGLDDALRRRLIERVRARPGQVRGQGVIPPALRRQLVDEQLETYAWIARTFLGREDGRLFYEPLPDPDAAWSPPAPLSREELVEALGPEGLLLP